MPDLLKKHRERIPYLGEMLFSILIFPSTYSFLDKWMQFQQWDQPIDDPGLAPLLCAIYVVLGFLNLFRAFRMREKSRSGFIAHLAYAALFVACGALVAICGYNTPTHTVLVLAFLGSMVSERVLAIVRKPRPLNIAFNAVVILIILEFSRIARETLSMIVVVLIILISALLSIIVGIFSRIRTDILREIIRQTYAVEIISGLLITMVAFSCMLLYFEDSIHNFWDGLWYCFAVVTTIGFGDFTTTTFLGRMLSVILGVYGIVVVALITSIIVNFYGEIKKESHTEEAGEDRPNG